MMYASINIRARVRGDNGTCAGIFTYADDTNESDIEILTSDPKSLVRLTNQPGATPGASSDFELPGNASWSDWQTYRLDWTPTTSAWYVNGSLVLTKTVNIPKVPSLIILNLVSFIFHTCIHAIRNELTVHSGATVTLGRKTCLQAALLIWTSSGLTLPSMARARLQLARMLVPWAHIRDWRFVCGLFASS
jgi:hypothetical protein